jgi:multiple antibiotic resistance protein
MAHWSDYMRLVVAMLAIVNPIGAIPVFLALTRGQPDAVRNRAAVTAALTVACALTLSIFAGDWVLRAFGIDVPCFQVGGGILLLLMAVSMFHAQPSRSQHTPEEAREAEERETVGVVPLGTPLLAGPGAISTAIIYAQKASNWVEFAVLVSVCLFVAACAWIALRLASPIARILGQTGINILTRLMGLILAAVAVKFITDGIGHLLLGLAPK